MAKWSRTNRREFLAGQSAARALEDTVDHLAPEDPVRESRAAATPSANSTKTAAGSFLIEVARRAMACEFQVYLNAGEYDQAAERALHALDVIEQLEEQLSIFRPQSEVCHLNRQAYDNEVAVESRLFQLLQRAQQLSQLTDGAFDITSGPLSKLWGFTRREGRVPSDEALRQCLQSVGWQHLQLDEHDRSIRFLKPNVEINLGAIGKGYALDRAAEAMAAEGIGDLLIHGGQSSVLARGTRAGRNGWTVGLRHPLRPEWRLGEILLRNQSLGTSGQANQYFHYQGRRLGHVLDPRTGWPAEQLLSATALAPTAAEADALATAMFVLGIEGTERICQQRRDVSAILVAPGSRTGSYEVYKFGVPDDQWIPGTRE